MKKNSKTEINFGFPLVFLQCWNLIFRLVQISSELPTSLVERKWTLLIWVKPARPLTSLFLSLLPPPYPEHYRRDVEWGLQSVYNTTLLLLLPPHIFPLLQHGSFSQATIFQEKTAPEKIYCGFPVGHRSCQKSCFFMASSPWAAVPARN